MKQQHRRIVLFYSYSSDFLDTILRDKLARFLRPLVRETYVEEWSAQQILPGVDFTQERKRALESATHILLLLSAEYFASDVCYQEMLEALERQKCGKARVIPILLRPCLLPKPLEESLSCLPSNARPISVWQKRDKAFFDVTRDIYRILGLPLASLRRRSTKRDRLLDRVFAYWIEGLLEPSLKEGGAHLELALQEQPGMIINPWSSLVQELHPVPRSSPDGRSIDQIYDHADSELLILGESGAGKTILLLELARTLLERAEKDERTSMPVVFHLSSWEDKHQPLRVWLVEELWKRYQVPRKVGQGWIDTGQVIPLLDGLDEVRKEDTRIACVEAINNYYRSQLEHHGSSSLVVCCRSEQYAALPTCLLLQSTVGIQPLTDEQINSYLESFGEQRTELKQALDKDTELRELARQPLMLHFFTLAYQGSHASEVPIGETPVKTRNTIFARYVEHMLKRREELKCWKQEQVIRWLMFLAKQMQQHNLTIFSVEDLQPTWLSRRQEILYRWCAGLIAGLTAGFIAKLIAGVIFGLIFGLGFGLFFGLIFGLFAGRATEIDPVEALTWSWQDARYDLDFALGFGLIFGLIVGLFFGLDFGLLAGLSAILFFVLNAGLRGKDKAPFSNSPKRSSKMGMIFGLIVGLFYPVVIGVLYILIMGLFFRLTAFVMHVILRFFLSLQGDLPCILIPFLDEAAARLLLRKVNGSYIFVHQMLLDYLASQEVALFSSVLSSDPLRKSPPPPH